jgi:hypothetical protein
LTGRRSVPSLLRTIAIFIASMHAARVGAVNAAEARGTGMSLHQRAVQAQAVRPMLSAAGRQKTGRGNTTSDSTTITVVFDSSALPADIASSRMVPEARHWLRGHDTPTGGWGLDALAASIQPTAQHVSPPGAYRGWIPAPATCDAHRARAPNRVPHG